MGLPMRALDTQVDMIKWAKTPLGEGFIHALMPQEENVRNRNVIAKVFDWTLGTGETYAVTDEIGTVIETASHSIPEFELHNADIPAATGFIYFDTPIVQPDTYGKPLVIRAISWGRAITVNGDMATLDMTDKPRSSRGDNTRGIVVILFTVPDDPRDHMNAEWSTGLRDMWKDHGKRPDLLPMWGGIMMIGETNNEPLFRFLLTFFRFTQEPWVETRMMAPSRTALRRVARCVPISEVRVICLRERAERRPHRDDDGEGQEWSHRWVVRPHWRNQWYPKEQRHAPRWIPSFIKGPEDKPLIVKDRVFHVSR